jgi:formylglycine-generating enzyme required for sulfatase activity
LSRSLLSLLLAVWVALTLVGTAADSDPSLSLPEVPRNSLGMIFRPLPGTTLAVSIWETRVQDYAVYVKANRLDWPRPEFAQGSTHPAVNISWEDATRFARWLTARELIKGTIPEGAIYRLPTSAEWSLAAGLAADTLALDPRYSWGTEWPPLKGAGNFSPQLSVDSFPQTAPVGSFAPNSLGYFDLAGNVWEWCQDIFSDSLNLRTLRGASWRMFRPNDLRLAYQVGNLSDLRLNSYGFRLLLDLTATTPAPAPTTSPTP